MTAIQYGAEAWIRSVDEDGDRDVPDTERDVMVFLCGDRKLFDPRPDDAGYGLKIGWFDRDAWMWRVEGEFNRYVTHWRELPPPPSTAE